MSPESKLINLISQSSNRDGNLLIEFLDTYNLDGLRQADASQLEEFIKKKGIATT